MESQLFRFLCDLFEMNPELGKIVLDDSDYSPHIIGLVESDPSSLNVSFTELRKKSIKLLRTNYPEKLASLVK